VPGRIRQVIRACLQKNAKQRIGDVQDVRLALEGAFETTVSGTVAPTPAPQPRPFWRRALPVVGAAVVASAMVGAAAWTLKPTPPLTVARFAFALGEGQQLYNGSQPLTISPDGTLLVYVANGQLYLRSMSDLEARPIPITQQTPGLLNPVFSPDSRSIAFFSTSDRTIKKIAVGGGAAVMICPVDGAFYGMTWDTGGMVFGQAGKRIMRVSANGGQPEVLVSAKDGEVMYGPQVLPGGEWLLFTLATATTADGWDKAQIVVRSLKTSERKTLVSGGSDGRYLPTEHPCTRLAASCSPCRSICGDSRSRVDRCPSSKASGDPPQAAPAPRISASPPPGPSCSSQVPFRHRGLSSISRWSIETGRRSR
jgi:hypothetical protein